MRIQVDKSGEERLKQAYDLGFYYEKEYKGCCQCCIAALQDILCMQNDAVFKAGTALSGGGCATGTGACGGLTGGIMIISSKFGRERNNFKDPEGIRYKTRELALKLHNKFIEAYGTNICAEIQKKLFGRHYNFLDPAEFEAFEKAGGHVDKCTSVIGNATRWTVEIIDSASED
jgi:C_GCAxxG_C_C family probable redox protein